MFVDSVDFWSLQLACNDLNRIQVAVVNDSICLPYNTDHYLPFVKRWGGVCTSSRVGIAVDCRMKIHLSSHLKCSQEINRICCALKSKVVMFLDLFSFLCFLCKRQTIVEWTPFC